MILIPPLLYSLITENKINALAVKVYRILKMYSANDMKPKLDTILNDTELSEKDYRVCLEQLKDHGFVEIVRKPGNPTEYKILTGNNVS